jgi:hypothetical protein
MTSPTEDELRRCREAVGLPAAAQDSATEDEMRRRHKDALVAAGWQEPDAQRPGGLPVADKTITIGIGARPVRTVVGSIRVSRQLLDETQGDEKFIPAVPVPWRRRLSYALTRRRTWLALRIAPWLDNWGVED